MWEVVLIVRKVRKERRDIAVLQLGKYKIKLNALNVLGDISCVIVDEIKKRKGQFKKIQ